MKSVVCVDDFSARIPPYIISHGKFGLNSTRIHINVYPCSLHSRRIRHVCLERLSRNSCLRFADWTTCNMSIFDRAGIRLRPVRGRKLVRVGKKKEWGGETFRGFTTKLPSENCTKFIPLMCVCVCVFGENSWKGCKLAMRHVAKAHFSSSLSRIGGNDKNFMPICQFLWTSSPRVCRVLKIG